MSDAPTPLDPQPPSEDRNGGPSPSVDSEPPGGVFAKLVGRPITLLVLFATLLVIGLIAYSRIPVQMMPEGIVEPGLGVWVSHPGSSAQENDKKVTGPLEEQLKTLPSIGDIESRSSNNSVWIWVEFQSDVDMDLAKAEVRDRIERARPLLPDTVDRIGIRSFNQDAMPIMFAAVLTPEKSERTDFLMDTVIQRRLEAVDGVGQAEIHGALDEAIRILLDEDKVAAARLDLGALVRRLAGDNFALPMGEVSDGGRRVLLRSDMRFETLEEIENYPVGNGLVLADLGEVLRTQSVRNRLFRIDGQYAHWCELRKDSQANVVATCHRLLEAFDELRADPRLGGEFEFLVVFDQGEFIESSLGQLRETAMWGGGLALVVLFVFLRRVRLTLCVALSIPVSVLLAIAWVFFGGGSFNVLTMTGVTLAMGMLVDNAVVVIENISRRRALGNNARDAAIHGAREVGLAVALATLTTVVVFLPLIFMTGNPMMRIMFGELGLPLCISLMISLGVALIFLPVIAARVVGPRHVLVERSAGWIEPIASVPGRLIQGILGLFHRLVYGTAVVLGRVQAVALRVLTPLRFPLAAGVAWLTWSAVTKAEKISGAAAPLAPLHALPQGATLATATGRAMAYGLPAAAAISLLLLGLPRWRALAAKPLARPSHFGPAGHGVLDMIVAANRGLLRWSLQHRLLSCMLAFLALMSIAIPRANMEMASFGQDENTGRIDVNVELEKNFTLFEADQEMSRYERWFEERKEHFGFENLACRFDNEGGRISLYWEENQSPDTIESLQRELRSDLPRYAGHRIRLRGDGESVNEQSKTQVVFRLFGTDSDELEQIGLEAEERLANLPGLASLSSLADNAPEQLQVRVDPDLSAALGVTANSTQQMIGWALRGSQLPRFQEPGRELPFLIEYDSEKVAGLDTLRDMKVFTQESSVPLSSFASLEFVPGSRTIRRRNGKTTYTIVGEVDNPLQQLAVSAAGYAALDEIEFPRGYGVLRDESLENRQEEEFAEMKSAFLLSIVLVFLLMGILLESFLLPFSVLFTIPFAILGSFWTLYLTGTTMDSVGWIGIIILAGVVVNNGIVLIDCIHGLAQGTSGENAMPRTEAVLEGSARRVRPILMTALTTVFGLLPMALADPPSQGIDYRALATCVAGGLTVSTFFTVWVVPLAYTVIDDLARAVSLRFRWALRPVGRSQGDGSAPEPPSGGAPGPAMGTPSALHPD